jgi:NAD(P)-dependent dehydrogenase (short-subunit alcohol dehydrogenase family)
VYCASKGAVVQMTRQLAIEFADRGLRVNSVAPGAIDTPFLHRHIAAQPDPAAAEDAVRAAHPLGRSATPAEIAKTIAFLASEDAAYITGEILMIDGGYTAR